MSTFSVSSYDPSFVDSNGKFWGINEPDDDYKGGSADAWRSRIMAAKAADEQNRKNQSSGGGYGVSGSASGNGSINGSLQDAAAAADPWAKNRNQYQNALNGLMNTGSSSMAADPSYQWRFDQGAKALERSNAAKGFLGSGNILTALTDYGQGAASQEYSNQFNRLSKLAGVDASSPSAAGGIMAQAPGLNLQANNQAFNQNTQSQLLPGQIEALKNGNANSALEMSVTQNALNNLQDAKYAAQSAKSNQNYPGSFLGGSSSGAALTSGSDALQAELEASRKKQEAADKAYSASALQNQLYGY